MIYCERSQRRSLTAELSGTRNTLYRNIRWITYPTIKLYACTTWLTYFFYFFFFFPRKPCKANIGSWKYYVSCNNMQRPISFTDTPAYATLYHNILLYMNMISSWTVVFGSEQTFFRASKYLNIKNYSIKKTVFSHAKTNSNEISHNDITIL